MQSLSWEILHYIVSENYYYRTEKSVCPSVLVSSLEENNGSFVGDRHPYRIVTSSADSASVSTTESSGLLSDVFVEKINSASGSAPVPVTVMSENLDEDEVQRGRPINPIWIFEMYNHFIKVITL